MDFRALLVLKVLKAM
jgi:hypothetical protein